MLICIKYAFNQPFLQRIHTARDRPCVLAYSTRKAIKSAMMIPIKHVLSKDVKSPFADFIRSAKSKEKKRVYGVVLAEATKQQLLLMKANEAKT